MMINIGYTTEYWLLGIPFFLNVFSHDVQHLDVGFQFPDLGLNLAAAVKVSSPNH